MEDSRHGSKSDLLPKYIPPLLVTEVGTYYSHKQKLLHLSPCQLEQKAAFEQTGTSHDWYYAQVDSSHGVLKVFHSTANILAKDP